MTLYVKVQIYPDPDSFSWYVAPLDKRMDLSELEGSEIGEGYLITRIEMTDAEFAELPDFAGF